MTRREKMQAFNRVLFAWHKKHYRRMAWRNTRDPYRVLVSEIMLQQTQVERVRGKYAEFLKKFPSVHELAQASLGEVLRVWSGLGYNRRAKYLHECAKVVAEDHGGRFPETYEDLVRLPGIGRSTAGALLAFCFGHDTPMIDTNIRRILCRVFYPHKMSRSDLDIKLPSDKELYDFASLVIPKGKGRVWNYAMLDLGATRCTARSHRGDCPLTKLHGNVGDFVFKKPQKKFAHSDRYFRGRIMRLVLMRPQAKLSLMRELQLDRPRFGAIVEGLVNDKLVRTRGGTIFPP